MFHRVKETVAWAAVADDVTLELAARLRAAVVPLSRSLRQNAGGGLTATQGSVLGAILRHGPLPMGELAEREQLSAPMVTKVVASLDDEGLVTRTTAADDARVTLVEVSDHGRRFIAESRRRRDQWLAERLEQLGDDDRRALAQAVDALERLVVDEP